MEDDKVRLQKFLANSGVASRRKCEELILEGKISVNGKVIKELGTKIDPTVDKVEYCGKLIQNTERLVYILLNKPIGYVRVVPVGRLDMYTSGALILTNDGDFVYRVTHPKHEITKTYTVTVHGIITNEAVERLRNGVEIDDYVTRPAKVKILKTDEEKNISRLEITIHEGKNRQVRKMCEAVGSKVIALHRSKIGNIGVKDLKLGNWRYLSESELKQFKI